MTIWVLRGARAGDTAQAEELARQLTGAVRTIQLAFTGRQHLPNWLAGINVASLAPESRAEISPPWPDVVIGTGKRTAPVAAWIRQQSGGHTVAVQLGRPRLPFDAFDLIVSTPQYGLPAHPRVMEIAVPFALPKPVVAATLDHWQSAWKVLPRPWVACVIGAGKFPLRLGTSQLDEFALACDRLAQRLGGSLLLFDSPRSATAALSRVSGQVSSPRWRDDRGPPGNAYQSVLALADQFAVTGDSVSMVAEMLATGRPTHVYPLPNWPSLRWRRQYPLAQALARRGLLSPTRDVQHFMDGLIAAGLTGDLGRGIAPHTDFDVKAVHAPVVARIRALLAARTGGAQDRDS